MSQDQWNTVDGYITNWLIARDPDLEGALAASTAAGLPEIAVTPAQGKQLLILAQLVGARNILEVGTLGGYSTLWLARALPPGGRLITLEAVEKHAQVAQANIVRAGFGGVVELRLGPALETLPKLAAEGYRPFDMIFIDADKANIPEYFRWALKLSRPGSLIVVDNVVRRGALADPANQDPDVQGVQRLHEMLAAEPRVTATTIQTVGTKGYDGFTMARVND
jgi:predicted O-methyltransferase YrrM